MYIYIYIHIYIYIYIYMHLYIYIYIYIYDTDHRRARREGTKLEAQSIKGQSKKGGVAKASWILRLGVEASSRESWQDIVVICVSAFRACEDIEDLYANDETDKQHIMCMLSFMLISTLRRK